jgi:phosphomannomutase/phosphoglucomutase
MLNPAIFREYDIRGVADQELRDIDIEMLGRGVGTYLRRHGGDRINLGRDCRLSSERLRNALMCGLKASGCQVTDIGVVPTPLLYYSVFHLPSDAGIMITGSHNPPEYNGFKIVCGPSTIHGEEIQQIRRLIERRDFLSGAGSERSVDVAEPYVNEIGAQFHFARRIKVVIDAGNGTGGPIMHRLLQKLNCEATELFFEMDGRFPNHHPDPTVMENLEPLIAAVREQNADLGIAFDGDTDRIGAVDENGNVVYGDRLMIVYAREILSRKPGATIIGEVKCSQLLYDDIRKRGGNAIMWRTGHSLIKAKMKECHAELAGEMSGHMFFADRFYGFDDALYAACRLLEIAANSGAPLSSQLSDLPPTFATPEIRVDCPDASKFAIVGRVREIFQRDHDVIAIDGARIKFGRGWGLVRASNTQPVLVLRFEAQSPELLAEYRKLVEDAVAEASRQLSATQSRSERAN